MSEFEPFNLNLVNFCWSRFGTVALLYWFMWDHNRKCGKGKNYFPFLFVFFEPYNECFLFKSSSLPFTNLRYQQIKFAFWLFKSRAVNITDLWDWPNFVASLQTVDAGLPFDDVEKQLREMVLDCVTKCQKGKVLSKLWSTWNMFMHDFHVGMFVMNIILECLIPKTNPCIS